MKRTGLAMMPMPPAGHLRARHAQAATWSIAGTTCFVGHVSCTQYDVIGLTNRSTRRPEECPP